MEEQGIDALRDVIAKIGDLGISIAAILADGKVTITDIPEGISAITKTIGLIGSLPEAALEAADLSEDEIKTLGPLAIGAVFGVINALKGHG